ncbi:EXLDI protein, partial [Kibdelosporangium lantanae]
VVVEVGALAGGLPERAEGDQSALDGADVRYPVYIDPTMTGTRGHFLTVQSGGWNYYDDNDEPMRVGYCGWAECTSSNGVGRSYFSSSWDRRPAEATLTVADTLEELRDRIPAELYEMVVALADQPEVEDLDI